MWQRLDKLHTIVLLQKWSSSGIWICTLSLVYFCLGFISFISFWPLYFSYPLIFLLGYTLFTFFNFFDFLVFQEYGTPLLKKEGLNIFHSSIKTIMKDETYWYRRLTLAPLGDGFSLWKVKNSRSDAWKCLQTGSMKSSFFW